MLSERSWDERRRELDARCAGAMGRVRRRLEELPRSAPFWAGTNGRPTDFKLDAFLRHALERDPHDEEALWAAIGLALESCRGFGSRHWRQLAACATVDPSWPILAAHHVLSTSGADTAHALAELLQGLQLLEAAGPILDGLDGPADRAWAARVRRG